MSRYLELLCNAHCTQNDNAGMVRFVVGLVGNKVCVNLKNVILTPRKGKETCNFRIDVAILPIKRGPSCFSSSKSTEIYHNRNVVIFDMDETKHKHKEDYKFEFDLGEEPNVSEQDDCVKYLEISFYDISSALLWKYFRGHVLIPINNDVIKFQTCDEFNFYSQTTSNLVEGKFMFADTMESFNDTLNDKNGDLLIAAYNELKQRNELYSQHYLIFRDTQYQNCKTGICTGIRTPSILFKECPQKY